MEEETTGRQNFVVSIAGVADPITGIARIFAWFGAALRSSSVDLGIATSEPRVDTIYQPAVQVAG
jgi:hypothetical protein